MTPEEAIEQLGERLTISRMRTVKRLMKECVATAKAEAKENETRRCAARARLNCKASCNKMVIYIGDKIADDILTSGGLKVEE